MNPDLPKYAEYLIFINQKISKFFDHQKPYIKCHKGCAKCCKNAEFPYKKIEFDMLCFGFSMLPKYKKNIIIENVKKIKKEHENTEGRFSYDCPFLIDDVCSVYPFRGVICRSFGLMFYRENDTPGIPFCIFDGLNYSMLLNKETGRVSTAKYKEFGYEQEPLAFNVSHSFLTHEDFGKMFGFTFGETKPLIERFDDSFYDL